MGVACVGKGIQAVSSPATLEAHLALALDPDGPGLLASSVAGGNTRYIFRSPATFEAPRAAALGPDRLGALLAKFAGYWVETPGLRSQRGG